MAAIGQPILASEKPDHVVFSFHGLPERHVRKADRSGKHCLASDDCCAQLGEHNQDCYRAQCYVTARKLASVLHLEPTSWTVAFQSRLGRTPWIRPHTDTLLGELAAAGKQRVAVFCPAFVADCLETLEEIGIRARQQFLASGGQSLTLIPSLNSEDAWADVVVGFARDPKLHEPLAS